MYDISDFAGKLNKFSYLIRLHIGSWHKVVDQ